MCLNLFRPLHCCTQPGLVLFCFAIFAITHSLTFAFICLVASIGWTVVYCAWFVCVSLLVYTHISIWAYCQCLAKAATYSTTDRDYFKWTHIETNRNDGKRANIICIYVLHFFSLFFLLFGLLRLLTTTTTNQQQLQQKQI